MTTEGIEAVFLETHNWGKSARFFQGLGYEIEFATDHNSGQLRSGAGPPLFIAEVPHTDPTPLHILLPGLSGSIGARDRFIDDPATEQADHGVGQYVLLGGGLDTFAQRRPELASRITVFELDQAGPQAWKRRRLVKLGFGIPEWLRLVP